jgi:hypothetical protein
MMNWRYGADRLIQLIVAGVEISPSSFTVLIVGPLSA